MALQGFKNHYVLEDVNTLVMPAYDMVMLFRGLRKDVLFTPSSLRRTVAVPSLSVLMLNWDNLTPAGVMMS